MLRAIRFTAKYNWKLPMFMIRALKKNAPQLRNISRERIHDEVNKMLLTNYPAKSMRLLRVLGLMVFVFVDLVNKPKEEYALLDNLPKELSIRLAGLFAESETGVAERDLRDTKYQLSTIQDVSTIIENYKFVIDKNAESVEFIRAILMAIGPQKLDLVLKFSGGYASFKGIEINTKELSLKAVEQSQYMAQHPLPVTGQDIIDLGIKPGPVFKILLDLVKKIYIKNPETSKETYLDVIKNHMQK
jgi:tRNA nucleotidyltransferase/poly(A) polymerase